MYLNYIYFRSLPKKRNSNKKQKKTHTREIIGIMSD